MPHAAVEIANEFLRIPGAAKSLTQMQLQKLAYIAHGWNLVINGEPLIDETPQAWTFGPVYPSLYEHTKYFGRAPIGREITSGDTNVFRFFGDGEPTKQPPYKAKLSDREIKIIQNVWKRYGKLSGITLSEMTHQPNTPWYLAYQRGGKNEPLQQEDIIVHYQELARRAASATAAA